MKIIKSTIYTHLCLSCCLLCLTLSAQQIQASTLQTQQLAQNVRSQETINFDRQDQSGMPVPVDSELGAHGYVWEDSGLVLGILDGDDIGLKGVKVIAVGRNLSNSDNIIIARTFTDENGLFQFSEEVSKRAYSFSVTSIPNGFTISPHSIRTSRNGAFIHGGIRYQYYSNKYSSYSLGGFGFAIGFRHDQRGLALNRLGDKPEFTSIKLRGGVDLVTDGILGTTGIEVPAGRLHSTLDATTREYVLYDDQMRPIMSSLQHAGSPSLLPALEFLPVDASRDYTVCVSPDDDISHFIPLTNRPGTESKPRFNNVVGAFNDFDPETGCAKLNKDTDSIATLLVKRDDLLNDLPVKLFGSVWVYDVFYSQPILKRAPTVTFNLFDAASGELVTSAQSGIKTLNHGIEAISNRDTIYVDDSDLVYFPDQLAANEYYVCVETGFKQLGFEISALGSFDPDTACTDAFRFPEQRHSHIPTLILENISGADEPEPPVPLYGGEVSGFVWLDHNGDGLNNGESDFPDDSTTMVLYPTGSLEAIDSVHLGHIGRAGHFNFENLNKGSYYVCMSRQFINQGLVVTTQDAGDDARDSDFDEQPCAYDLVVSETQSSRVGLGLVDPLTVHNLNNISITGGVLSINHTWQPISEAINSDHAKPVFFFTALSANGLQRGVVRMRRTNAGVQFRFQEWSNLDDLHVNETIHIVNMSEGHWSEDNTQVEVGRSEISGTRRWKTISFATTFNTPPVVILGLQTANGGDAVDVHVRNITTTSMQIALYEQESHMASGHVVEIAGYLLVASDQASVYLGPGYGHHIKLPFSNTGIKINHNWTNLSRDFQIRLEEDQTADQEILHVNEIIQLLNIDGIYLTQIASSKGFDPAVLRSRIR